MSSDPVFKIIGSTGEAIADVAARSQTPTGNALQVQIGPGDPISNLPVMILFEHHQIHEGEVWDYVYAATNQNGAKDFRIVVANVAPTTRTPHVVAEVISDSTLTRMYWYEGTTWTAGGVDDSANIYNRNRNILGAPTTKVYVAGGTALTPNALGTNFWQGMLFAGKNAAAVAESRSATEWVLKTNTEYLFRVTTAAAANCMVRLSFYEDGGV